MSTGPLVSVLIPCFNAERTVAEAIQSALAQSHRPLEVLVVDDGSTDSSLEVIRSFGTPEVKWTHTTNRGGNAARNLLLSQADGEFVQFLDADDLLGPTKISRQLAAGSPDAGVVFCDYEERSEVAAQADREVRLPPVEGDLVAYIIRNSVWTSVPLHRRKQLLRIGGFQEGLTCCQEYELHVRLARREWSSVVHVPDLLAIRRKTPGSVSSRHDKVYPVMLSLLRRWATELEAESAFHADRRAAVSEQAYICGRHLVRQDMVQSALMAFALSRTCSMAGRLPTRGLLGALTLLIGPVRAERIRGLLNRGRHPREVHVDEQPAP